ncbi:MAG: hypothetical protein U0531_13300 [Dehalococcoidia bacterium]
MRQGRTEQTARLQGTTAPWPPSRPRWPARLGAALSGIIGAVAGLAPHLLHHLAPIAGAALLTVTVGSAIFGALGLVLMAPMLRRLRRRLGTWLAPGIALALFVAMFTVSTLWIGPAVRGVGEPPATPRTLDERGH